MKNIFIGIFLFAIFFPQQARAISSAEECDAVKGAYCCESLDTSKERSIGYCSEPDPENPGSGSLCCISGGTSTPSSSFSYTPLESIPGEGKPENLPAYLKALYNFTLASVGIAALLMAIIGGFFYVTSAGNSSRVEKGKELITDALLGIAVAFLSWLVLYVINPDLVNVNLDSLSALKIGEGDENPETPAESYRGPNNGCGKISETALAMANKEGCLYSMDKRANQCSTVPGYFDCSSLVVFAYKKAGCESPGSTTADMYRRATDFNGDSEQLKAGDALVYDSVHNPSGGQYGHIVICLTDGCDQVAHASTSHPKSGNPDDQIRVSSGQHYKNINGIRVIHASQFCRDASATKC